KIIDIGSIAKTVEALKKSKNQPPGFESFEITRDELIDPFIEMVSNLRGNKPYREKLDPLPNLVRDTNLENDAKKLSEVYQDIIRG
ncbi:7_t:CDS:2, partial [Racocetra fulgida]